MVYDSGTWFIVLAKGTGYYKQAYNWMRDKSAIGTTIKDRWKQGCKITGSTFGR